jgi:putative tryptophan/tyrosine transport system substrate-binding protein
MRRREFIGSVIGTAVAWPLAARAQQRAKLSTIGFFGTTNPSAAGQRTAAFVQRLYELGWIEGRTVAVEYLWAEGRTERFAEIAAELVRLQVDVIVTSGAGPVIACPADTVGIICGHLTRPIAKGLWVTIQSGRLQPYYAPDGEDRGRDCRRSLRE